MASASHTPLSVLRNENHAAKAFSRKFLLWLVLISIAMFFAALTSAYLVKSGDNDFQTYGLPSWFGYTTGLIVLSSLCMQLAYRSAKRNELNPLRVFLWMTFVLGFLFILGQYAGWRALVGADVYLVGNPGGSFLYVMSGAHLLHLLAGLFYLFYILLRAYRYAVHSENMLAIEMCATYWHFIGALWVYLYYFLVFNL